MAFQPGFWDYEEHLARLTKGGDLLVKLAAVVDFEPFRYRLEKAFKRSEGSPIVHLACRDRRLKSLHATHPGLGP